MKVLLPTILIALLSHHVWATRNLNSLVDTKYHKLENIKSFGKIKNNAKFSIVNTTQTTNKGCNDENFKFTYCLTIYF